MIIHILTFISAMCPLEEQPIKEEPLISCSCKKKRKNSYQETLIACACDEEPLLEEDTSV